MTNYHHLYYYSIFIKQLQESAWWNYKSNNPFFCSAFGLYQLLTDCCLTLLRLNVALFFTNWSLRLSVCRLVRSSFFVWTLRVARWEWTRLAWKWKQPVKRGHNSLKVWHDKLRLSNRSIYDVKYWVYSSRFNSCSNKHQLFFSPRIHLRTKRRTAV